MTPAAPERTLAPVEEIAGNKPASKAVQKDEAKREQEHACVQVNCFGTGKIVPIVREPTGRREGKQNTDRSPADADQQTLRHLLGDEDQPTASQGTADG